MWSRWLAAEGVAESGLAAIPKTGVTGVTGRWSRETLGNKANSAVVTKKRNAGQNGVLLRGISGVVVTAATICFVHRELNTADEPFQSEAPLGLYALTALVGGLLAADLGPILAGWTVAGTAIRRRSPAAGGGCIQRGLMQRWKASSLIAINLRIAASLK